MGCSNIKEVQKPMKNDVVLKAPMTKKSQILKNKWTCPNCMSQFKAGTEISKFHQHIKTCITQADNAPQSSLPNLKQLEKNKNTVINQKKHKNSENFTFEKDSQDPNCLSYSWVKKVQTDVRPPSLIIRSSIEEIKSSNFQSKQIWFRSQIEKLRISWENGSHWVKIDKKNILESSINQFKNINMRQQIKIKFSDEKAHDAGGLLRQWIHLVIKEIFNPELGMFIRAETEQLTYKLQCCSLFGKERGEKICQLFGLILGKAIFQKIPISSYIDRTIIRQLCDKEIDISDVFSYDKSLYQSWRYILQNNIQTSQNSTEGVEFYYTIMVQNPKDGSFYDHELIKDGATTLVNQNNKKDFIDKWYSSIDFSIKFMCYQKVKYFIQKIKKGLYAVIPKKLLNIFHPHQVQMLLYGAPIIDVQDWQVNTQYKGAFHEKHKTICWFWKFVSTLSQQKLSKLLHFCTGTTRVPLNGFKKLETNRGGYSKFVIQSAQYKTNDPYPKGHTCFNRLELPVYPNKNVLEEHMTFIIEANLEGIYGLD